MQLKPTVNVFSKILITSLLACNVVATFNKSLSMQLLKELAKLFSLQLNPLASYIN